METPSSKNVFNSFGNEDEDLFASPIQHTKGKGYDRERGTETERRTKITKHSQFAQLVGQQSIVIDNIRKSAGDLLTMWKQTSVQIATLNKSVETHISMHKANRLFDQNQTEQCHDILNKYENQMKSLIQMMEVACAHVEGLPAVVEGDFGIYTKETQPTAPLFRRENGATMRNGVYDIIFESAKDSASSSKGIVTINEKEEEEEEERQIKTPVKKERARSSSPAPSTVISNVSVSNLHTKKEQGPMRTFVTEQICIIAAQKDLDEKVCLRMMKKKRNSLGDRSGISATISLMKRILKMNCTSEDVMSLVTSFLETMDLQNESSVENTLMEMQNVKTQEDVDRVWAALVD
ncbi:hypothetical protein E4U61_003499 [Claviceps capensis]|nr:hypothetical protein E4U61_003499 [Claviceps capensis]